MWRAFRAGNFLGRHFCWTSCRQWLGWYMGRKFGGNLTGGREGGGDGSDTRCEQITAQLII
jgi:hypothetical protein